MKKWGKDDRTLGYSRFVTMGFGSHKHGTAMSNRDLVPSEGFLPR